MATPTIKSPFGAADQFALLATGATALTIANRHTLVDGATVQLTGAATLNLTVDSRTEIGSVIVLKAAFAGITTLAFGTGFTCPTLTGAAGKTFVASFAYDAVILSIFFGVIYFSSHYLLFNIAVLIFAINLA